MDSMTRERVRGASEKGISSSGEHLGTKGTVVRQDDLWLWAFKVFRPSLLVALLIPFGTALSQEITDRPTEGYGLIAHWSFDQNMASSVWPDLYSGRGVGEPYFSLTQDTSMARVGSGALRLDSGPRSGNKTHVNVDAPWVGRSGLDVISIAGWYRYEDLSGDGSDVRNFVWETYPNYALALGLREVDGRRHVEWWFQTQTGPGLSSLQGPEIVPGQWHHAALIWNRPAGWARFYHDGVLVDDRPILADVRLADFEGLRLGNHRAGNGERDWDGYLDDIATWDVPLTSRQVAALARGESAMSVLEKFPETELHALVARPPVPPIVLPPWHESRPLGPLHGHIDSSTAILWARIPGVQQVRLLAWPAEDGDTSEPVRVEQTTGSDVDYTLHFRLTGLQPDTTYAYRFEGEGLPVEFTTSDKARTFRTAPPEDRPAKVRLGFGSCADFSDSLVWSRLVTEELDGMVLLGDTPYIDTTDVVRVRGAYRRFSSIPRLVEAFQTMPFWGTWDDHDYGLNDGDGRMPGKEWTRRGFVEYRPNTTFGHEDQGVYTRFRRGPVEVFLLDTRWFARTESSWADPSKPGLLGLRQWEWLQQGLLNSTAPFKLLACGMIWDDKKNTESDDWGTYDYERQAIQTWLGENNISGVVLIGGDIHVSRLLQYETADQVGYNLYQFIVSPLHNRVIPSLNVPHPALIKSSLEPHVFLRITADSTVEPPTLHAEWIQQEGHRVIEVSTNARALAKP